MYLKKAAKSKNIALRKTKIDNQGIEELIWKK